MKIIAKTKSEISISLIGYSPLLILATLFYGVAIALGLISLNNHLFLLAVPSTNILFFSIFISAILMVLYAYWVICVFSGSYIELSEGKLIIRASHGFSSSPIEYELSQISSLEFGQPLNWAEDILSKAKGHGVPGLGIVSLVEDVKEGKLYVTVGKKTNTFNFIGKAFDEEDIQSFMLELSKNNVPLNIT